jgi:hypothetical protein
MSLLGFLECFRIEYGVRPIDHVVAFSTLDVRIESWRLFSWVSQKETFRGNPFQWAREFGQFILGGGFPGRASAPGTLMPVTFACPSA